MVIVAIDPGIVGAACAFWRRDDDGPEFIADCIDLPTMEDGENRQIDVIKLAQWLRRVGPAHAFVERVRAMPSIPDKTTGERRSMGAASSFRFGGAFFAIRTTIKLSGIPMTLVEPRTWKTFYGLKGPNKEQSRQLALQLYPAAGPYLKRKKDHGRAEAILLARWGERRMAQHELLKARA